VDVIPSNSKNINKNTNNNDDDEDEDVIAKESRLSTLSIKNNLNLSYYNIPDYKDKNYDSLFVFNHANLSLLKEKFYRDDKTTNTFVPFIAKKKPLSNDLLFKRLGDLNGIEMLDKYKKPSENDQKHLFSFLSKYLLNPDNGFSTKNYDFDNAHQNILFTNYNGKNTDKKNIYDKEDTITKQKQQNNNRFYLKNISNIYFPHTKIMSSSSSKFLSLVSSLNYSIKNNSDSNVRLFNDSFASELSNMLGVDAFVAGNNSIFFAQGKFNLNSHAGLALFAHELTHIRQIRTKALGKNTLQNLSQQHITSLENEALDNEKKVIEYFNRSKKGPFFKSNSKLLYNLGLESSLLSELESTLIHNNQGSSSKSILTRDSHKHNNSSILYEDNNVDNKKNTNSISNNSIDLQNIEIPIPLLFAESGRSINSSGITSEQSLSSTRPISEGFSSNVSKSANNLALSGSSSSSLSDLPSISQNINTIADKVFDLLESKIKMQKERRGFR